MKQGGSPNNFSLSPIKTQIPFASTTNKGIFTNLTKGKNSFFKICLESSPTHEFETSQEILELKSRA